MRRRVGRVGEGNYSNSYFLNNSNTFDFPPT